MEIDAYFERFENILELELLGELAEGKKEKLIAELLEEIGRILESPLHLRNLKEQGKDDFQLLYSKIVRSSKP